MGTNPQDGAGPEYFPTQVRETAHREASEETGGWGSVVTFIGGSNGGSRLRGDRNIHHEEVEHGRAVYCDVTDYGTL